MTHVNKIITFSNARKIALTSGCIYEEKWQLQYKCIRTAFNPKYIAPDLNIVHRSSRGEAKLPINTIAAHFFPFSPAAVQSWHYEINLKALEPEGEVLTDRSTNKQNSTGVKSTPYGQKSRWKTLLLFTPPAPRLSSRGKKSASPARLAELIIHVHNFKMTAQYIFPLS